MYIHLLPMAGLHYLSCWCHLFGQRKRITFSYTTNVGAHAGVTLKKKTTTTMKQTIYSEINNKCVFTAHRALFLWYVTVIVIIEVNCQSGDILWPEIFLSFTSRPIGEMRVTLLYAKKSLPSIKLTHLISP